MKRWILVLSALAAAAILPAACDWTQPDTAGGGGCERAITVAVSPPQACIDVKGTIEPNGGGSDAVRIQGTNDCADALVLTTADGGVTSSSPGSAVDVLVAVELPLSETDGGQSDSWSVPGKLGNEPIAIVVKRAC